MFNRNSLTYGIYTQDFYWNIPPYIDERFDDSDYPKDQKYYSYENQKKMGNLKDESVGVILCEFVRLRPKLYSYVTVKHKVEQI